MLAPGSYAWIAALAIVTFAFVGALVVFTMLRRVASVAASRYVERRRERLLPLVLGSLADPTDLSELRRALRPYDHRLVLEMLMRLAIDVREEDGTDIVRLCGGLGLLEREIRCLRGLQSRTRRRAAANLGLLRQAAAIPTLVRMLADRNTNVRLAAIDALADIRCHQGLVELIPWLGDPEPAVAWRVQEALSRGGCDVGPQLVRFVLRCEDPHAQGAAIRVLRWVNPERAVTRLCAFSRVQSPELRTEVARGLAAIGTERCAEQLQSMLADPSPEVRAAAVRGLGSLGRTTPVESLRAALADESRRVRSQAARSLVELGDSGIEALLTATAGRPAPGRAAAPDLAAESERALASAHATTSGRVAASGQAATSERAAVSEHAAASERCSGPGRAAERIPA